MDIVSALGAKLELDESTAAGLAGALLLLVEERLRERDAAAAERFREAVPELGEWQSWAPTIAPGLLSVDALPFPTAEGDEAELGAVLSRFEIQLAAGPVATSLIHQFLCTRLDDLALAEVVEALPTLAQES